MRIADALGNRADMNVAVVNVPALLTVVCGSAAGEGGHAALKRGLIRFFEPFKHLRWGDRPFRQMRIERARADI